MLGGGTYIVQNKILGGSYFKFVSIPETTATIADRGMAAIALDLTWGKDGEIFTVSAQDFIKNSLEIFGFAYDAEEMKPLRELFLHTKEAHIYKLTSGGAKASNIYATAVHTGTRGNALKVKIAKNADNSSLYDVTLYLDTVVVDSQTVATASDLKDNAFVVWKKGASLSVIASSPLTSGSDGEGGTPAHQAFLDKLESYSDTNAIGYMGDDESVKSLYVAYTKRLRDEVGIRMQCVVFNKKADSISVVNVKNCTAVVPWVLGVIAGTACNKSATNMTYDGELTIPVDYTQRELETALTGGEFVLHRVGTEVRVLEDINSFTSVTDEQGEVFKDNQTVRTCDTFCDSVASVFASKYLGKVPNDASGRVSLWNDIVAICNQLASIRAIENFEGTDIVVSKGEEKKSVLVESAITVVNSFVKLYAKTVIA